MSAPGRPSRGLATTSIREHIKRMTHAESLPRRPTLFAAGISARQAGEVLVLDEEESRHVRALRLAPGSSIRLTDGAGTLWDARLSSGSGRTAECVLDARSVPAPALPVELAFGVGNKAHVMWLVEKATEMGVSRLVPVESERTRSVADAGRSPAFWNKARRRAISAMKQSGGAWLPEFEAPRQLDDYTARRTGSGDRTPDAPDLLVRLDGAGGVLTGVLAPWAGARPVGILVGPEGGWSAGEIALLDDAGLVPASLGPLVLRFETAAIASVAIVAQHILARDAAGDRPHSRQAGG